MYFGWIQNPSRECFIVVFQWEMSMTCFQQKLILYGVSVFELFTFYYHSYGMFFLSRYSRNLTLADLILATEFVTVAGFTLRTNIFATRAKETCLITTIYQNVSSRLCILPCLLVIRLRSYVTGYYMQYMIQKPPQHISHYISRVLNIANVLGVPAA